MKTGFIRGSIRFIGKHFVSISLVILVLFLITSYIVLHNIVFPKSHPVLQRVVVMENFGEPLGEAPVSNSNASRLGSTPSYLDFDNNVLPRRFCATHLTDFEAGDAACRQLETSDTCNLTNCCVWATHRQDGEGCTSGNHLGPTFNASEYKPRFKFLGKEYTI